MSNFSSRDDLLAINATTDRLMDLDGRREEILDRILKAENEIGEARLANLELFITNFNNFYNSLDNNIAKRASTLSSEMLLVERLMDKAARAADKVEAAANASSGGGGGRGGGSGGKRKKRGGAAGGGGQPPEPPDGGDDGGSRLPNRNRGSGARYVRSTTGEDQRESLTGHRRGDGSRDGGENYANGVIRFLMQSEDERRRQVTGASNAGARNGITPMLDENGALGRRRRKKEEETWKRHAKKKADIEQTYMDLEIAMYRDAAQQEADLTEYRLTRIQEVGNAELNAANLFNDIQDQLRYAGSMVGYDEETRTSEAGLMRSRESDAAVRESELKAYRERMDAWEKRQELQARSKNGGELSAADATRIQKEKERLFNAERAHDEKRRKAAVQLEVDERRKKDTKERQENISALFSNQSSWAQRKEAFYQLTHDETGKVSGAKVTAALVQGLDNGVKALSNFVQKLNSTVDTIGSFKSVVDTRLQGWSGPQKNGSYWDQMVRDMTSIGAVNPFFKQEDFANNMKSLVESGIAFDVEQRAFLKTIQSKIANTFEVADGTLARLIRIQSEDTTAGRLGMESTMNAFLNQMYETSEYLSDVAGSVKSSLEELESLMSGKEAAELEFEVQKWFGSLYSVGMSKEAVNSIGNALGQIGAGQLEGLTGGGAGNLLVMAANDAGLSIADVLTDGLNASDTNKLLKAAVNYLAELSESAADNRVVQQQLASVFGVKASDLRAATNLLPSTNDVFGYSSNYTQMTKRLIAMASSMGSRTSLSEKMSNIWANGQYTLAGGIASNPISYFIYNLANVANDNIGGIKIPGINIMGNMVELNTSISDLMRIGALAGGIFSSLGPIISGLGNSFDGAKMLSTLGIKGDANLNVVQRGSISAQDASSLQKSVSESGYAGNGAGGDIQSSTMQEAEDDKKKKMIEAKEDEEANQVDVLNVTVIKIYELLDAVAQGKSSFKVKVEGYGLTNKSNIGGSGAIGGVSALNSKSGAGSSSIGGVNSSSISGSVDTAGWLAT